MIFVNCMDHFVRAPWWLHHQRAGMSLNDTIAPLFVFVVGMGFRLSFARQVEAQGWWTAARRSVRRYLILTGIGLVIYFGWWWDALTDIGLAGLLALPVMHRSAVVRAGYACALLVVFQGIASLTPYGGWSSANSLNGGPLGPLAWSFILLNGTLAWDLTATGKGRRIALGCLAAGVLLVLSGYAFSLSWGELKAAWPVSPFYMTAPFTLIYTGLCWGTLLLFVGLCDWAGLRVSWLELLGRNPLVLYLVQFVLVGVVQGTVPREGGWPVIVGSFVAVYAVCHAVAYGLDRRGSIVKV
jgi:hypothetical protein